MPTKHEINVQDTFLFQLLKSEEPVAIELMTGRELIGVVKRFDRFALLLQMTDGGETMIYKHAIATLVQKKESS